MMQVKNFHILIDGRVQGVGYRRFVHIKACAQNLKGWVRNLLDGRVEIMVSGNETNLNMFIDELKRGPTFSRVREVKVNIIDEEQQSDFAIKDDKEIK